MIARSGSRPRTTTTNPQQQLDQQADEEGIREELALRSFALPRVVEEPSGISVPGARAMVLADAAARGPSEAFLIGTEFAHLHPAPDLSLHLSLPVEAAAEAIEAGWAELHPWALEGRMAPTRILVYAPRDRDELETVWGLVAASHRFATGVAP